MRLSIYTVLQIKSTPMARVLQNPAGNVQTLEATSPHTKILRKRGSLELGLSLISDVSSGTAFSPLAIFS